MDQKNLKQTCGKCYRAHFANNYEKKQFQVLSVLVQESNTELEQICAKCSGNKPSIINYLIKEQKNGR